MALGPLLLAKIGPHHRLLSSAAYLAGLVVICIFPAFDRRTEIEEHALIPGYATSGMLGDWPQQLQSRIKEFEGGANIDDALDKAMVSAQLVAHRANFTTSTGTKSSFVYTVVPSSRGDSREACVVVIATNWTSDKRTLSKASLGLGVGVTLAKYLKTVPWLSKDTFVVFVDSSLAYGAGARAWLRDYFGGVSSVRRGVLRQAVVLETNAGPTSMLIESEGINGMLPNQDIVNAYMISARDRGNMQVYHRDVWSSVFHHIRNGGVHSQHAPFLELQVPSYTIRGRRSSAARKQGVTADPIALARSLEGIVRSMSNNLQQLHHSFNFYFFTAENRHISNGLYLYPVFAMQLPLLSFLMTSVAYTDIRSLLVGLGAIVSTIAFAGSPVFFLATDDGLARWLAELFPSSEIHRPPTCEHPSFGGVDNRRTVAASWLCCGAAAVVLVALVLRQYAWRLFDEKGDEALKSEGGCSERRKSRSDGVRLSAPLWEAMRAASGFAFLLALAPTTIYSWALAVPLTIIVVPQLVLTQPFSLRRRPVRSLFLLAFVAGNAFLLALPPALRAEVLVGKPGQLGAQIHGAYFQSLLPMVPRKAWKFMPTKLVEWLFQGNLSEAFSADLLVGLYESARDFKCVGGMLFPIFCFVYWPFLAFLVTVGMVLPAQRVDNEGFTFAQLRLGLLVVMSLLVGAVVGGVFWRSYSSAGLGALQW